MIVNYIQLQHKTTCVWSSLWVLPPKEGTCVGDTNVMVSKKPDTSDGKPGGPNASL